MFSLSRAIEEFSIKRQERQLTQKIERDRLKAIPYTFGTSIEELRELFSKPADEIQLPYPKAEHFGSFGLEAFFIFLNIDINAFPACFNLIKQGKNEVSKNHFEAEGKHTFLNISEEFCGRNVRLLTNDIDLIQTISKRRFGPPPPWIVWYELGPTGVLARQGNAEFWFAHVWDPFWNNLNSEERTSYLADWRARTKSYLSDEELDEWASWMEVREPGYWERNKEDNDGERND